MTFSLYAAIVPSNLQILGSVVGLLDKAEAFCNEKNIAPSEIIEARLFEDMLPFAFQMRGAVVHSIGAIESVRQGGYNPDTSPTVKSFAQLRESIVGAIAALKAVEPSEVDAFVGRDVRLEAGELRLNFLAENFLLSLSQPNFYFHTTTAYNILRMKGVNIGKLDFMGQMRLKA